MKVFWKILLHTFGDMLPDSYFSIKIGNKQIRFKSGFIFRRFCAKHIIRECGKEVNIERFTHFSTDIHLGDYSGIGNRCEIPSKTYIGNYVMMGPEVVIYSSNHKMDNNGIPMCKQGFQEVKPVHIGNDVWLGRRVMIMPGVTIGDGCVIGAGAVVAKDIPPYSVAVGNPARVVKIRNGIHK